MNNEELIVAGDDEEVIIAKYLMYRPIHLNLTESYDYLLHVALGKYLKDRPLIDNSSKNGLVAYVEFISVKTPTYHDQRKKTQEYLYPHEATLYGHSYSGSVLGRIVCQRSGFPDSVSSSFEVFKIPIMTGSSSCNLRNIKDPLKLIARGEDTANIRGTFIIGGTEWSIPYGERMRYNQILIYSSPMGSAGLFYHQVVQTIPHGSTTHKFTVSQETVDREEGMKKATVENVTELSFGTDSLGKKSVLSAKKMAKNNNSINVLSMCALINKYSEEKAMSTDEIVAFSREALISLVPHAHSSSILMKFASTVQRFRATDMQTESVKIAKGINIVGADKIKEFIEDGSLDNLVRKLVYPNIPSNEPRKKMWAIMVLTARLLQHICGYLKTTSKNSWSYKSLISPHEAVMTCIKKHYGKVVRTFGERVRHSNADAESLSKLYISAGLGSIFTSSLENDFKNYDPNSLKAEKRKRKGIAAQQLRRKDLTMQLRPSNIIERNSLLGKITPGVSAKTKSMDNRGSRGEQLGYVCISTATDTGTCGLVKFIAMTCAVTINSDPDIVVRALTTHRVLSDKYSLKDAFVPVSVNGSLVGWTNESGYTKCVILRRNEIIPKEVCIIPTVSGFLELYSDSGRLIRPVLTVGNNFKPYIYQMGDDWKNVTFSQLLANGYAEYLDAYEQEYAGNIVASTFNALDIDKRRIESIRKSITEMVSGGDYYENMKADYENMLRYPYNYVNPHPIVASGVTASLSPAASHNQSCRLAFQIKMLNQAMGTPHSNPYRHLNEYRMLYQTRPSFDTVMADIYGFQSKLPGQTMMIAFMAMEENQEDAIILNKAAIEAGLFRYMTTSIYERKLERGETFGRVTSSLAEGNVLNSDKYRFIQSNGLPAIGAFLEPGDCVIGVYVEKSDERRSAQDKSEYVTIAHGGTVAEVISYRSSPDMPYPDTVSVKVNIVLNPSKGGKSASRYAQKVTVGLIANDVDMPFITGGVPHSMLGMRPHGIINPHCIPTRMTPGSLLEPEISTAYALKGKRYNMTAHREFKYAEITDLLRKLGYTRHGGVTMTSGITGEELTGEIFVGDTYYQQLGHVAIDKIQARSKGEISKNTRQASGSKRVEASTGTKFGEWERDACLKSGAPYFVSERFNATSDGYLMVVCKSCSRHADYGDSKFFCKFCGPTAKFGKLLKPYTTISLSMVMSSMGVDIRGIVTEEVVTATRTEQEDVGSAESYSDVDDISDVESD